MISEPHDVTVCEGREAVFSCVLNRNSNISSEGIQWYRLIQDTSTIEMINPDGENITISTHTGNTLISSLTITDTVKSYTGYYWVKLSSDGVCNVSLTVVTSMYALVN